MTADHNSVSTISFDAGYGLPGISYLRANFCLVKRSGRVDVDGNLFVTLAIVEYLVRA